MRFERLLASIAIAASGAACTSAPDDTTADATVDDTVRYRVNINMRDDVVVTIDGVPLDPGSAGIDVEYPDYATALAAPLFQIETWIDGALVDAIEIGIGACEERCDLLQSDVCLGEPVKDEQVPAIFDEDGTFLGGAPDPRSWRQIDCMRCTFQNGYELATCT